MEMINKAQLSKLHVLLQQMGLMSMKRDIIAEVTEQRTDSSKELTKKEAIHLIKILASADPSERIKKAIWMLAYNAGMMQGHSKEDWQMNRAKMDAFLSERGVVKKPLNKMSYEELKQVQRQFEGIARNNRKTADNKDAKRATTKLLSELNINVKQ